MIKKWAGKRPVWVHDHAGIATIAPHSVVLSEMEKLCR